MTTFIIILIVLVAPVIVFFLHKEATKAIKSHKEQNLRLWCITSLSNNVEDVDGVEYHFEILNRLPSDQLKICKTIGPLMIGSGNYNIQQVVSLAQYVIRGVISEPPL